jgi:ATP-binding cassette subfamily F protein 3
MSKKLQIKLANPALYEDKEAAVIWQKKYSEVVDALERAESLWMDALEKLEKANG